MLPPKKRAKIIAALKANPNASAVARQIGGIHVKTVAKIAKRTGIVLAAACAARRLTPKKRARIIAALKANPNASAVARQVSGVSNVTVWKIAKQTGIKLTAGKAARRTLPPKTRAKIVAALKTNPNAKAVARQVGGVSNVTVWRIAKQTGVKLAAGKAARRTLPPKKRAKIIAALKANPNASAVARLLGGVSCQTVWGIAKHTGIDLTAGKAARGNRRAKRTAALSAHK